MPNQRNHDEPDEQRRFGAAHVAPGRIGLCGGRDWINQLIRKSQAPITADGHRSLWSHAFVFHGKNVAPHDIDGSPLRHRTTIRDLGVSTLREFRQETQSMLYAWVDPD